jgi:hypothetical protein
MEATMTPHTLPGSLFCTCGHSPEVHSHDGACVGVSDYCWRRCECEQYRAMEEWVEAVAEKAEGKN